MDYYQESIKLINSIEFSIDYPADKEILIETINNAWLYCVEVNDYTLMKTEYESLKDFLNGWHKLED